MGDLKSPYAWRRAAAGVGSALCAWVAADVLLNSGLVSGSASDPLFFWSWGVPFAAGSVYLGWLCASGRRPESWRRARLGCLGAVWSGSGAFVVFFLGRTLSGLGALNGVVEGLRWSPAVAALALMVTLLSGAKRGRRLPMRRPPES